MIDSRLITFLVLIRTKSYTKTAHELFITQPAVTHHIKTLEKENNVKLFANPKTFRLSMAGQIIYDYAVKCQLMHRQLTCALEKEANPKHIMKFGTTKQAVAGFLNPILIEWMRLHPKDKLVMYVDDYEQIKKKILLGEIDFAIIDDYYDKSIFNGYFLCELQASFYVGANHLLKHKKSITMEQLARETMIVDTKNTALRNIVYTLFKSNNYHISNMKNTVEIDEPQTMKDMVVNNLGVSLLYDDFVKDELNKTIFKIGVNGNPFIQSIHAICSNDLLMIKQFEGILKELMQIYHKLQEAVHDS